MLTGVPSVKAAGGSGRVGAVGKSQASVGACARSGDSTGVCEASVVLSFDMVSMVLVASRVCQGQRVGKDWGL